MKIIVLLLFSYCGLILNGNSQQIYTSEIIGKWEVVKVTENEQDITSSIDNNAQRWIEFVTNDRYSSDGYPFGRYEGEYLFDENTGSLLLKSGSSGTKGMTWEAGYDGEYLILKGTGQLKLYKFFLRKTFF